MDLTQAVGRAEHRYVAWGLKIKKKTYAGVDKLPSDKAESSTVTTNVTIPSKLTQNMEKTQLIRSVEGNIASSKS